MNPHQKNKIDVSSLSADEQRLFRLYGKLPNKKDLLQNKLKERKYFDSGDYALSKAGKASDTGVTTIGTEHPQAENIPHLSASSPPNSASSPSGTIPGGFSGSISHHQESASHFLPGHRGQRGSIHGMSGMQAAAGFGIPGSQSRSPVKESSYLARTASVDEQELQGGGQQETVDDGEEAGEQTEVGKENREQLLKETGVISPPLMKEGLPIRR